MNAPKPPKLTLPQLQLLADLTDQSRYVAENYPPIKALVRLGLAESVGSNAYQATEAGKAHLKIIQP